MRQPDHFKGPEVEALDSPALSGERAPPSTCPSTRQSCATEAARPKVPPKRAQDVAQALARGRAVRAEPPATGMTECGAAAACAWCPRHGVSAEPAPAPAERGGAAAARPLCPGPRPDVARRGAARRERGCAAVPTAPAPPARYCPPAPKLQPSPLPSVPALGRRPTMTSGPARGAGRPAPRPQPRPPGLHLGFCPPRGAGELWPRPELGSARALRSSPPCVHVSPLSALVRFVILKPISPLVVLSSEVRIGFINRKYY